MRNYKISGGNADKHATLEKVGLNYSVYKSDGTILNTADKVFARKQFLNYLK